MPAYKLDKSLLFSVSLAPENRQSVIPAPSSSADGKESTVSPGGPTPQSKTSDFLSVERVKAAAKTLWSKSKKGPVTKKEGRIKMMKLLEWLSEKHMWVFTTNSHQSYRNRNLVVEGRVHSKIEFQGRRICIEICYDLDETVLFKLWAAHVSGATPLLIWMGAPAAEAAFNARLSKFFVGKPVLWLKVLQVEAT